MFFSVRIHGSFLFVNNVSSGIKKEKMMGDFINSAPLFVVILLLVVGFALLVKGADFFVEGSSSVAKKLAVPSIIIGLTIVAMGTSLPELVTSAVAASKGEADLAIGNVVGSNISNILLVLGLSAAISSVGVTAMNFVDIIVSLAATIIVFIVASTQRTIKKKEGIFLVIIYAFYMAYIICRQIYG